MWLFFWNYPTARWSHCLGPQTSLPSHRTYKLSLRQVATANQSVTQCDENHRLHQNLSNKSTKKHRKRYPQTAANRYHRKNRYCSLLHKTRQNKNPGGGPYLHLNPRVKQFKGELKNVEKPSPIVAHGCAPRPGLGARTPAYRVCVRAPTQPHGRTSGARSCARNGIVRLLAAAVGGQGPSRISILPCCRPFSYQCRGAGGWREGRGRTEHRRWAPHIPSACMRVQ